MSKQAVLLAGISSLAVLTAVPAWAQTTVPVSDQGAPEQPDEGLTTEVDEVVVTGTRAPGRSRLETISPVDVVTDEALTTQGTTELVEALSNVTPSVNFPRPAITDGTDVIRPATLRGLAPDQTLVLVNGARRHPSALVNVNGSVGRGSAAVDLNAIPSAALERIEVLREGASAQYGSDAIAGVINLRLREARSGGAVTATYGQYVTEVRTARSTRDERDGETLTVSGWQGLPLGAEGFLTISAEYRDRNPTSRGDLDVRTALGVNPNRITSRFGDARVEDATVYLNAGLPLSNGFELYGWTGYQQRDGESAAFFRPALDARNVLSIYPNGFLPLITSDVQDFTAAGGVRGEIGGFNADLNLVYGRNKLEYGVENSLNASFGPTSQTSFDAGGLEYDQLVLGLDLSRGFEAGFFEPVNVAFGLEARTESYSIEAGEPASYQRGPVTSAALGAQGFPGFQPANEVDEDRTAVGVYLDVEGRLTEQFSASGALRFEDYSDFGSTVTGKMAGRFDFNPGFAARGSLSTGFRAPALQQAFFTATSTNFINGVPFEIGTFPATSPTAQVLGSRPLEAEESVNYSGGLVFRRGPFELTADAYRIEIDNRIVLSENIVGSATGTPTQQAIFALLQPFGVSTARFFVNGVDTETYGLDLVARWRLDAEEAGRFEFILAGNVNTTNVTAVPTTGALSALPVPPTIFGRVNVLTFEEGTPREKFVFTTEWSRGGFGATLRATHFGSVVEPGTAENGTLDVRTGDNILLDLEGRYRLPMGLSIAVGADNILDEYPDFVVPALNGTGALGFSRFSPFGFNGRFVYARIGYRW